MIEIKNLSFSYGKRKPLVLDNFSLSLQPGCIYGLLGKNGTGKSTLLYLLSGLLRPQQGSVMIQLKNGDWQEPQLRQPELLRDVMILPEEVDMPHVTLSEYVRLHRPFYPRFSQEILEAGLQEFDLPLDLNLGAVSMGQKKKALVCFALAANTRILLMDEPTNGLDIPAKSQFRKIIARHATEDRTIVISTHQVRDIEFLLDHILCISGSHLQLDKSVQEICDSLCFQQVETGVTPSDCLYSEPSMRGEAVITANEAGVETTLNLELLFNALQVNPEGILRHLQEK